MSEPQPNSLSNLKLSNDIISIAGETQSAELTLMNIHQNLNIYFKIKTKVEKVFDVKPVMGCIKPGDKKVINFKPYKKIEESQKANLEQNLQFLLKAVNSKVQEMNKEEEEKFWNQVKTKNTHMEIGYCTVKLNVTFSAQSREEKQFLPIFNKFDSKTDIRFTSLVKSSKVPSQNNSPDSNFKDFSNKDDKELISDAQLSKKYEQLKINQEKLIKQRSKMFENQPEPGKSKKGPSKAILIIVFIITFLLGNILKGTMTIKDSKPLQQKKGFLDWLS